MKLKMLAPLVGVLAIVAAGAASAAATIPQGPEPYSAPDPVYTPHKIESTVTIQAAKTPAPSLTDNWPAKTTHAD